MCTLTFWPTEDGGILTQNRDEQPARSSATLVRGSITYPRDVRAGGTWAAAHEDGTVRCLLNGAFVKHERKPTYRMSRGKMLLDSFAYESVVTFAQSFDFEGVEPFTLIDFTERQLVECRWDGAKLHVTTLPSDVPTIWSSCTLYPPDEQASRATAWQYWQPKAAAIDIWQLHTIRAVDGASLSMVREFEVGAKTVSTIQFEVAAGRTSVRYYERESGSIQHADLIILAPNMI